jgi:hypothetical protein
MMLSRFRAIEAAAGFSTELVAKGGRIKGLLKCQAPPALDVAVDCTVIDGYSKYTH